MLDKNAIDDTGIEMMKYVYNCKYNRKAIYMYTLIEQNNYIHGHGSCIGRLTWQWLFDFGDLFDSFIDPNSTNKREVFTAWCERWFFAHCRGCTSRTLGRTRHRWWLFVRGTGRRTIYGSCDWRMRFRSDALGNRWIFRKGRVQSRNVVRPLESFATETFIIPYQVFKLFSRHMRPTVLVPNSLDVFQ